MKPSPKEALSLKSTTSCEDISATKAQEPKAKRKRRTQKSNSQNNTTPSTDIDPVLLPITIEKHPPLPPNISVQPTPTFDTLDTLVNDATKEETNDQSESLEQTPITEEVLELKEIQSMPTNQLISFAGNLNLKLKSSAKRAQIVCEILRFYSKQPNTTIIAEGTLEIINDNYGLLKFPVYHYKSSSEDLYVHSGLMKKFDLRPGDSIKGSIRQPKEKEKYFALNKIIEINFKEPCPYKRRAFFEEYIPEPPSERIFLETTSENLSGRIIDLIAPIGKGQRALIVAPPRSGKTVLIKNIARSIRHNNPEIYLIILLINERPEEVTDMQQSVDAEVAAATFDEQPHRQTQLAEMVMDKAVRLAEAGKDVCILLDSITRLARAYNTVQPPSGKILSGGVDANSLHKPKRLFGLARKLAPEGSITIIATALSETGSRMDEVIFEEFKGTGNCEIVLSRQLAYRKIFPSFNIEQSGTRQEEKLFAPDEYEKCCALQQELSKYGLQESLNLLISRLKTSKSNFEFLLNLL